MSSRISSRRDLKCWEVSKGCPGEVSDELGSNGHTRAPSIHRGGHWSLLVPSAL